MNKKAFTMVELIFIIVILGILAIVAVPRLMATRDDAEISLFAQNFATLITDVAAYQTSRAEYSKKISDMTNVNVIDIMDYKAELQIRNSPCVEIIAYEEDDKASGIRAGMFEVKITQTPSALCQKAMEIPSIQNLMRDGKYLFLGEHISY
ncbi:MAG: type II secretion system protein [Campylobacteraceae bacterium]|nr:type II secretion system protein [Campylobacteraceae bacterium]